MIKLLRKAAQYGKVGYEKVKAYFRKDKDDTDSQINKSRTDEQITEDPYKGLSEKNGRADEKEWKDVIGDDSRTNPGIGIERGRSVAQQKPASASLPSEKELEDDKVKGIKKDELNKAKEQEERLSAEKDKSYGDKAEERLDELAEQKAAKERNAQRSWEEKENYRRGQIQQEEPSPAEPSEFSSIEEQSSIAENASKQIDLIRSDSSSFFIPSPKPNYSQINFPQTSGTEEVDLLRQDERTIPQSIIDEWHERRGAPINGEDYYQTHEEKEYSPPPMDMDVDGGEDGGNDGGSDGGSDGGGDGGGD